MEKKTKKHINILPSKCNLLKNIDLFQANLIYVYFM